MSRLAKFVIAVLAIFILGCVVFFTTFSWNQVNGTSMEPNIPNGSYVLFWKLAKVQRGSVVLYEPNPISGKMEDVSQVVFIGRVVGLPGETLLIEDGKVKNFEW